MKKSLTSVCVLSLFAASSAIAAGSVRIGGSGSMRAGSLKTIPEYEQSVSTTDTSRMALSKSNSSLSKKLSDVVRVKETQKPTTVKPVSETDVANLESRMADLQDALEKATAQLKDMKETFYTKSELDARLPQWDKENDRLSWQDPMAGLISVNMYPMNLLYSSDLWLNIGGDRIYYGTFYRYETNKTDAAIQQYVSSTICDGETSDWCWAEIDHATNGKFVNVYRLDHDCDAFGSSIYWNSPVGSMFYNPDHADTTHTMYWTFENDPDWFVRENVCGNRPQSECFVASGDMQAFGGYGSNGTSTNVYGHPMHFVEIVERGQHTGNKFADHLFLESNHLVQHYYVSAIPSVTTAEINAHVSELCNGESQFWCYILNNQIDTMASGTKAFTVVKRLHGYGLLDMHIADVDGEQWVNKLYYTNEQNPNTYIQNMICGNLPLSDCYVADYWDMIPINNAIEPGSGEKDARYQVSILESIDKSGNPNISYTPLKRK